MGEMTRKGFRMGERATGRDEYAQLRQEMNSRYRSVYALLATTFVGFFTIGAAAIGLGFRAGHQDPRCDPTYGVFLFATPILLMLILGSMTLSLDWLRNRAGITSHYVEQLSQSQ